uniref:RRM domain-containing protein n=1 Tax=Timema cristinae TaxID=61476 RepID=A0A7R9CRZ0_TIMCR|nr:unnamed protein product [Timema cristinae]
MDTEYSAGGIAKLLNPKGYTVPELKDFFEKRETVAYKKTSTKSKKRKPESTGGVVQSNLSEHDAKILNKTKRLKNNVVEGTPVKKQKIEENQHSILREKSKDFSAKSNKRVRKKKRIPRDEEKESRTIFVGNVPNSWNKFKIKRYFSKYGAVESLRLRCPPLADPRVPKKVAIIKKKFHPDRTNIHVFVCFVEKESAYKALAANGTLLDEHHIQVDLAENSSKAEHDPRKAIFIGNLPFSAEEEDLWKMFEECGNIENIRVSRDKYTGVGRGFGYVNFQNVDGVELALKLNGEKLKDRELRITRYTSSKKIKKTKKQFHGKVVQSDENTKGKNKKKKLSTAELKKKKIIKQLAVRKEK